MTCEHENFRASVDVFRLSAVEGGAVTHYNAEVRIQCDRCCVYFEPQGLPIGLNPYAPTTDLAGQTLNLPIMPPGEKPPEGLPGYGIDLAADFDRSAVKIAGDQFSDSQPCRARTGIVAVELGECLKCGAANGQSCLMFLQIEGDKA
jgi:hypothetical protein